jgi:hypothetical protein
MSHQVRKIRNFTFGAVLCLSVFGLTGCTSADKKACIDNNDLQACNRECARDDKEACSKAEVLRLKQEQQKKP